VCLFWEIKVLAPKYLFKITLRNLAAEVRLHSRARVVETLENNLHFTVYGQLNAEPWLCRSVEHSNEIDSCRVGSGTIPTCGPGLLKINQKPSLTGQGFLARPAGLTLIPMHLVKAHFYLRGTQARKSEPDPSSHYLCPTQPYICRLMKVILNCSSRCYKMVPSWTEGLGRIGYSITLDREIDSRQVIRFY
jgi:hypothetical protein